MPAFIVLEGINGSGKTTLSKTLAIDIDAFYIATPHKILSHIREKIDSNPRIGHRARFFYYMLGNILVSDEIKIIRRSRTVICDRYIHSTIARHKVLGFNVGLDINCLKLEVPDVNFFIFTSNESERRERILQRGKKTKWDELDEDSELRVRYIDYFRQMKEFIFIDTSHSKIEGSLKKIKLELSKRGIR